MVGRLVCSKGRGFSHVGFLYCSFIQYYTTPLEVASRQQRTKQLTATLLSTSYTHAGIHWAV